MDKDKEQIDVFSSKEELLFTVGKPSSLPGTFSMPSDVAVDRSGQIYVSDTRNHRVQIFDNNGNYVSSFGKEGIENGQFLYPQDVAVNDTTGNIHVTDSGNHRVQTFDKSGKFLYSFAQPVDYKWRFVPGGIEVDDSRIYVSNQQGNSSVFDTNGNYLYQLEAKYSGWGVNMPPDGMAIDDDRIYVADSSFSRILVFDKSGEPSHVLELSKGLHTFSAISGIDLDTSGIIYVSDFGMHLILLYGYDGRNLLKIGERGFDDGQFYAPQGIALDKDRKLYVADTSNHRIQVFEISADNQDIRNDIVENNNAKKTSSLSLFDIISNFFDGIFG